MALKDFEVFGGGKRLTPEELGLVFAHMASDEQAQFWNGVAEGAAEYAGPMQVDIQWLSVRDELLKPDNADGLAALQGLCAWMLLHAWQTVEPWR